MVKQRQLSLFVKSPFDTRTLSLSALKPDARAADVLRMAADRLQAPGCAAACSLVYQGRQLSEDACLCDLGVTSGATLHMVGRMRGGLPITVRLLTPETANVPGCGPSVTVDMEPDTPMYEVKLRLQVMLSGIGQLVMLDKRTNIGYTHSASTGSFYLATLGTASDSAPSGAGPSK